MFIRQLFRKLQVQLAQGISHLIKDFLVGQLTSVGIRVINVFRLVIGMLFDALRKGVNNCRLSSGVASHRENQRSLKLGGKLNSL